MAVVLPIFLLETLAAAYFGDLGVNAQQTIVAIAMAESRGDITAVGDNYLSGHQGENSAFRYDYGLLQINSVHEFDSELLVTDPVYNFKCGRIIYDYDGSFDPWVTFQYDKHLPWMPKNDEISTHRNFGGYLRLLWQAAKVAPESEASLLPLRHVNGQDRYLLRRVR